MFLFSDIFKNLVWQKIILLFLLYIISFSCCEAKLIYDNTGRITFETSNDWHYYNFADDAFTISLHSIALDKDTFVKFNQSKYTMPYKSMATMSMEEKSVMRDSIIQYHMSLFKNTGYIASINKTDIATNGIMAGFTIRKNGLEYQTATMFCIKNHIAYSLTVAGTPQTAFNALSIAKTLKIDGVPFSIWIID